MIVRVLMVRLPDDTRLAEVEDMREGAPQALAAFGLPADKVAKVEALEPGYCQMTEPQWQHYRGLYKLNCHREQA